MFRKPMLWLAALLLASGANAQQVNSDLSVELQPVRTSLNASDDVEFTVQITNNGRRSVRLLKWDIPGETDEASFFSVNRDGRDVLYIGKHYKRGAPAAADYLVLKAGETLSRKIDLSTQFDFTVTGNYNIQYAPQHFLPIDRGSLAANKAGAEQVAGIGTSPSVTIWVQAASESLIEKQLSEKVQTGQVVMQSVGYSSNCSTSRRSTIASAVNAANTMATNAKSYLQNTATANRSSSKRYKTWFGSYTSSRWTTATNHFVNIDDALDTKPLVFDCGCTDSAYAYVYPTQPYKVYLCSAFWSAPLSGTDSKGGTIVHELSHFNVVAATDDRAYGQSAAKSLAISNPTGALDNADSHEYFAENTPALP
ncbi:peptidase M35 [Permianibacter sp. IMCC34836]|uniref:M35 family metallo-endopeptidase n=1 Tax=Permianibacter fluminis TaxID=2738515 RepID=UPI001554C0BB|nr:M35 family metallo-endopeptidase [Permianibacter fluminis]NQD35576.1 peptidase M35 [Permianibacter fluminis]